MKFVTKVTQSGIARAMASALVLAVIVTSTGLSLADWGPERQDVTIRVFNGDPLQDIRVAGASLRLVADDSSNPDNGVQGTTDGNGTYFFRLYQGSYHIEVRHQDFYARDFHITVLSTFNGDLSIIPLESVPGPTPQPPAGGGCLPTPPRGIPMLNNWPISMGGEDCTDMPLVMARNVTRNQGYVSNGTVQTSTNETVRIHFYVHNGVQDFPDNIAQNVRVKGDISHSNRTATITAEAWADNANTITSAQKGGHVAVDMNPGETLEVIPGSAKVYGRGGNLIGSANDSVIGNGFNLGDMRGCFDFLRIVTVDAFVKGPTPTPPPPPPVNPPPPQPGAINIEKKVRNISDNETSFVESTDADPNEIVEFQIQVPVTNTVHNITVSDVLPNRLNYVNNSLTVNNASAGNNLNSVVIGTATNTTKTVKFRATVADASQFSSGNTELINVASVTSDAGNKTDTAKVIVHKQAVVANINIDKQVRNVSDNQSSFANSTNADPGEQVEFQLRVNTNGAVNNISVSDVLPGRLIYVNNSLRVDGAGAGNNLGGISLGSINSSTKTITFRANVAEASQFSTGNTTLTNIANLSSSAGSDSDSADVIVTKNPPQNTQTTLGIHKTVRNASVNPNGTFVESVEARKDEIVEFKIVVTNTGSLTANNVRLQDTLPNNPTLNYVSGSLRIDGNTSSVDVINNYGIIGDLTPGQSRTVTFKASVPTVTANQTVTNVATTFASNANSVSDTAQVVLIPVLSGHVNLVYSKKAFNNTQNKDATKVAAKPGDTITYTLTVQNTGTLDATLFVIEDNVLDIFQLSDPTNLNGGTYNFGSHVLSWPAVTVQANGGKVERTFSVRVKNPIPSGSDYVMTNVYGNEVKINIHKPGPYVAPKTGSAGTLSFTFALLTVGGFFLYRRYKAGKQLFGWVR